MAVKKISEFPVVNTVNAFIFGRSVNNKNIQIKVDEAIQGNTIKLGRVISNNNVVIDSNTSVADAVETVSNLIGRQTMNLVSSDESINITYNSSVNSIDLEVNVGRIIGSKSGLKTINNTLAIDIDEAEDNNLYLTSDGKLRSDNKWKNWIY